MTLLSDKQITATREQNGLLKLICIIIDRTVDALARLTGGQPLLIERSDLDGFTDVKYNIM